MGFGASLSFKKESETVSLSPTVRWFVLTSLAIFVIAVFWGLAVNLTRLWDFRWTARAARLTELRDRCSPQLLVPPTAQALRLFASLSRRYGSETRDPNRINRILSRSQAA